MTIASNSLAGTARSWATQARRAAAQIRQQHLQAEAAAAPNAVDHAHRYRNLGADWEADEDGIFAADVALMTQTAQGAADKGAA
jgi:hypothetical protein